ncbi:MAG: SRPBCC family protein [Polyangiaceae bacterium]
MAAFRVVCSRWMVVSLGLIGGAGCGAAGQSPRTVVDHVATVDTPPPADSSAPKADAPKADAPKTDTPKTDTPETVEPVAVAIPGSGLVEAKATLRAARSLDKAREVVLKFEDYPQFMPEYSGAKMLGKLPDGNDKVYMEITTLGGIAKMFANIEVLNKKDGLTETHEAKFLDGNVKEFKAIWTLTKVDDAHTEVTLQVFLHPAIPLPDFIVNKANLDGAKKGVIAMKKRIEAAP